MGRFSLQKLGIPVQLKTNLGKKTRKIKRKMGKKWGTGRGVNNNYRADLHTKRGSKKCKTNKGKSYPIFPIIRKEEEEQKKKNLPVQSKKKKKKGNKSQKEKKETTNVAEPAGLRNPFQAGPGGEGPFSEEEYLNQETRKRCGQKGEKKVEKRGEGRGQFQIKKIKESSATVCPGPRKA